MRGYRSAANVLKGLAHPARLAILQVLRDEGESCVCHLEHALDQRQAYISQQLARLRQAGLVHDRREGLNVYYALSDAAIGGLLDLVFNLTYAQARSQAVEVSFQAFSPDHRSTCPCPNCQVEPVGAAMKLEEKG